VIWYAHPRLALLLHGDVGLEPNEFGTSSWAAGALAVRFQAHPQLYLAARADYFHEDVAQDGTGGASAIFWPSPWVTSQTVTLDGRPHGKVSMRLEYRHDHADEPMFFEDDVATDMTGAFVPNARTQDTVTLGMVAWF
jgi:hypothetical protein